MFVFRNYTIENLFDEGTLFSGYDDISVIPETEDSYVWFYQVPILFDTIRQAEIVKAYKDKLQLIADRISSSSFYILSLENLYPVRLCENDTVLQDAIVDFNSFARNLADSNPNFRFVDFGEFLSQFSPDSWINWRFYFISQMILNPVYSGDFKEWWNRSLRILAGKRKKCLVLDLDNTLWGGVLGEDGISGIKVSGDYPGNAFEYFQKGLIALSEAGVILTVCSKNNEEDVKEAWDKNPFILLNDKNLAAWEINWDNKADNIHKLAKRLNIGLDSMVFVDDNPTERELIRQQLPMVEVPDFPKRPYDLPVFYNNLVNDYFRTYRLTSEDKEKSRQYKENAQRAAEASHFADLKEFIRSLDINIIIEEMNEFNLPRLTQMTQKTNQFNLTTHRYSEADILKLAEDGAKIFCISVSDKFGDNGITGEIIFRIEDKKAVIDTLLLSCRILGKGIENIFVKSVINRLIENGIEEFEAEYIPTAKNSQVSDFYDRIGFQTINNMEGKNLYRYIPENRFEIESNYTVKFKNK